jgi:hypothetical protein
VDVVPFPFEITIATSKPAVSPGDYFELEAVANREIYGTEHYVAIVDDDTGRLVTSCVTQTCIGRVNVSWDENAEARPHHYHAEIRDQAEHAVAGSDGVSVAIKRTTFDVTLEFSDRTVDEAGHAYYTATATATPTVHGTSYALVIRNSAGAAITACMWEPCAASHVGAGSYRATVEDNERREFGASATWTITDSKDPRDETVDGVDLVALAALLAADSDPCLRLAGFPGAPDTTPPSTINDFQKMCESMRAAGKSMLEILQTLAARPTTFAGASIAWWLMHAAATSDAPPYVPPFNPPWEPPTGNAGGDAARQAFGPGLGATAAALLAFQISRHALSQPEADAIARKCLEYTARIGYNSHDQCSSQPIFASGSDVPEATTHDIEALATYPGWVLLNYEYGETKQGAGWQSCPDQQPGQHCDEYPFFATEQGGPLARPLPHLKPIDATQNTSQGGMYRQFRSACDLTTGTPQVGANSIGGTRFLGIPVPPSLGVRTWYGCPH